MSQHLLLWVHIDILLVALPTAADMLMDFVISFGPTFPILTGSVTASLSAVADYAIQMIKKIQAEDLHSVTPRQDVSEQFNEHCQTMLHGTVWEEDCNSWYKRKSDGRITAVWPGKKHRRMRSLFEDELNLMPAY